MDHGLIFQDSFAILENTSLTLLSSGSPRSNPPNRTAMGSATSKRFSKQYGEYSPPNAVLESKSASNSRPSSPLASDPAVRILRQQRYGAAQSPAEQARLENSSNYFANTTAQPRTRPSTPSDLQNSVTARVAVQHSRANGSIDGSLMSNLPENQNIIRVISTGGVTKVVKIVDCTSCDQVMRMTLRKFNLREDHDRNYCFWTLAGIEPDPNMVRKLQETELWRIIKDSSRPERNRLILRKLHAGEPTMAELERAAAIAIEESTTSIAVSRDPAAKRSQAKVTKILGENWDAGMQGPLSPASFQSNISNGERERNFSVAAESLEGKQFDQGIAQARHGRKKNGSILKQLFGARPPSELITNDLTTFFPDHPQEEIDRTRRMSQRRSIRMSRVNSRLSVASNLSFTSTLSDAPPVPAVASQWLPAGLGVKPRAINLSRNGQTMYRDSVASSVLEPLAEESNEPDRQSYVSFDSNSDNAMVSVIDPDGNNVSQRAGSYYDDGGAESGNSLDNIREALNQDGEEVDEELQSFLAGESWGQEKWMKGALIGQGSFGSVYLALHAITGELIAVKQVEAPSVGANNPNDARKKSMIDALKREIALLRDLQHPNIVQYLGCSSTTDHLNIFLEYVPGGSVSTMLNSYGPLKEPLVRSFCRQIVTGLVYLHGKDIIHRDIKGANILVDNKGAIKISDFGISKKVEATNLLAATGNQNKNRPSMQGSVFWMAPEVVKQTSYTRKADIWSLGCLVIEMLTGEHPYPDCSQLQAIFKIGGAKASPTIPDDVSEEAVVFLKSTFEMNQHDRPSSEELKLSPFLSPPV